MSKLSEFIEERNIVLLSLDIDGARRLLHFPACADDETILGAMHKARVEVVAFPDKVRRESMEWLKERGWLRQFLQEWPADGSLPEAKH